MDRGGPDQRLLDRLRERSAAHLPRRLSDDDVTALDRDAAALFAAGDASAALSRVNRLVLLAPRGPFAALYYQRALIRAALRDVSFYAFDMREALARRGDGTLDRVSPSELEAETQRAAAAWRTLELGGPGFVEGQRRKYLASAHHDLGMQALAADRRDEAVAQLTLALEHHIGVATLWYCAFALLLEDPSLARDCLARAERCDPRERESFLRTVPPERARDVQALSAILAATARVDTTPAWTRWVAGLALVAILATLVAWALAR